MLLSIDVGIRNLAMCLIDEETKVVHQWDVSGVPPQHEDGLYVCLNRHLNDRPWVLDASTILIEKQPDRNRKMKTVENFLHSYFVIKSPKAETLIYDARYKIPDVVGPGKSQYRQRKLTSIQRCKEFLDNSPVNSHWLETFRTSKKKDDLADTVMQALSYTNRTEVTGKKKSENKEKKIVARKPNEHQKDTKYSKSNLAWFVKNNDKLELEKNKRFMKDLKRYYTDFEELLTHVNVTTK